jgi:hypothetical protein
LVLALTISVLLPLVFIVSPAQAQAPALQIEVVPNTVELASEGEASVLVIARNPSSDTLREVQLSYFTSSGASVTVEPPSSDVISPYGALTWNLLLSQGDEGPTEGTLYLRIDYAWAQSQGGTVPCVAYSSLEITTRELEPAENVVAVTTQAAAGTLMEDRPVTLYLNIENKLDVPLTITRVISQATEGIDLHLPASPEGDVLAPGEVRAVEVTVDVTGSVWSGKHLLLFELAFNWERLGQPMTTNVVITHEVEVGVLGEAGILGALGLAAVGVPAFLILPGFLILMTVKLLQGRVATPAADSPLAGFLQDIQDRTKPEFYFVAITLSLPVTLLYPVVTRVLGSPRNLIRGYALSDVIAVWIGSILLGVLAYFSIVGLTELIRGARRREQEREEARRTPAEGDDPITILCKLHEQGLGVWRDRVAVNVQGQEVKYAFLAQLKAEGKEKIWVVPPILIKWKSGAEQGLREQVVAQLTQDGNAQDLARLLEEASKLGSDVVQIDWVVKGPLNGPYLAQVEDITGVEASGSSITPNVIADIKALSST